MLIFDNSGESWRNKVQCGEIWRNDGSLEMGKIIDLLDPFTEESRNRRMRADVL